MIALVRFFLRILYRFRAYNEAPLKTNGPVLLLPNHISWWDWLLIGACLETDWRFVTSSKAAQVSWLHKLIMVNRRTFPVDVDSPYAVKRMAEYLQHGGRLVLFPEGRISSTGSLMKLFDGTGFLISKTHAKVITAYIRGGHRLPFSRNPDKKTLFPKLSVHFSDVLAPPAYHHMTTAQARTHLTDWLRDCMVNQQFETEMHFGPRTLPEAIAQAVGEQPRKVVLQDVTGHELTFRRFLTAAELLAGIWRELLPTLDSNESPRVGVLLPNVNAMPLVTLSLWLANRVPTILNYTSGAPTVLSCARLAGLKQIVTSAQFLKRLEIPPGLFQNAGIELLLMETAKDKMTFSRKLLVVLKQRFGLSPRPRLCPDHTAVVLFTSGSEGEPKGVELTHANLLANIRQMLSVVDLLSTDRFFNALPLFHSFGLTVGLLLPLVRGVFTFLYLSPLHYRVVPTAFYDLNCTVFFGTNTFLTGYARKAHAYDFRSVRYLFAGAEKLQDSTATLWMRKFGVRIIEGYGATECSPCISANTPMRPRYGSAGQVLPGVDCRIEPVEGVPEGGRLFVRGPNIMRGYLNPEPNAYFKALGGWYDTGDIARLDEDGYLYILGRLKRFAKISGEMVSLAAVEDALSGAFPQYGLRLATAVCAKPDEGKGEKLVVVTNEPKVNLEQIREVLRSRGFSNLAIPRELKVIDEIPRLGTGKVNHRALEKMI